MTGLEERLRARRAAGAKSLVPYVTGGVAPGWTDHLRAYEDAGADAIEIGLPFSDPVLDGETVREACDRAIARGASVGSILGDLRGVDVRVPLVAMTCANLVFRGGADAFCRSLGEAGISGLVVPDIPLDEADEVSAAAAAAGIELILLAAPSTPERRLRAIAAHGRGFVYAVSVMGTTGERDELGGDAAGLVAALREVTDVPVLLGFGVSGPGTAARAARHADGVVVGSALVRRVLDGAGPGEVGATLTAMRTAIDAEPAR